jgi:hypothetical protein
MCGASGTIAAVTKDRCLCDVSCSLAMDQRRMQGSSSWTDIITLIQFQVMLNKSALECYMLKERLRDTSSFIRNCSPVDEHHSELQERQTTPITTQPQQRWWVNAKWKSDICPWTYAQYLIKLGWHHTLLRNNLRLIGLIQPYYNLSLTSYILYEKAAHMSCSNNLLGIYRLICSL